MVCGSEGMDHHGSLMEYLLSFYKMPNLAMGFVGAGTENKTKIPILSL